MNICKVRDQGQAKSLNACSKSVRREVHPFSLPCGWKTSPVKIKHQESDRRAPAEYPKKSVFTKSTSEISVTSEKSLIYSSPKGITKDISIQNEHFKRTVTLSPKQKFRRDLFVIPEHTCRKRILIVPIEYKSEKSSQWQNIRKLTSSPAFKYSIYRSSIKDDQQYDRTHRDLKIPHKEEKQKIEQKCFIKAPVHDLRKEGEKRPIKPPVYNLREKEKEHSAKYLVYDLKEGQKRSMKPSVYELKEKGQKHFIKPAAYNLKISHEKDKGYPRSEIKHDKTNKEDKTNSNIKHTKHQKETKNDSRYAENQAREASRSGHMNHKKPADKPRSRESNKSKPEKREQAKSLQRMEQEMSFQSTEDSDGSSQTKFYSLTSDYETEQGVMKQSDHSGDSTTSVYSVYQDSRSRSSRSFKSSEYHQNPSHDKKYHLENQNNIYEIYNAHELSASRGKEIEKLKDKHKKGKDKFYWEKLSKRKQANPSKIVHFEDSADEEKNFSNKTLTKCSPKRSSYAVLHRSDKEPYEIAYSEESLEDYIKRKAIEEHKRYVTLMKYIVNQKAMKEYREKYAKNNSPHPHKSKSVSKTKQKNYDYRLSIVDQEYHSKRHPEEDCEACAIERFLAE